MCQVCSNQIENALSSEQGKSAKVKMWVYIFYSLSHVVHNQSG